jgi:phosphoglycerol geranylgeranyltransferase
MKKGKVENYIHEILESKGAMLFTLIDPMDYKTPELAIKTARGAADAGADALVIGGSTGAQGELLDMVADEIKKAIEVPLILFPGNIATITKHADAIYFMSLLNARNPYWITQAQMLSAPVIRSSGIEPLPTGYIVVSPGGTVGWVGDANLVPREKPTVAAGLALAGQYLGNRFIITDTGSNPMAQNSGPIPAEMIRAVKSIAEVPYIVAGGITNVKQLQEAYRSGADIVQVGTALQGGKSASKTAQSFIKVTREEGARRVREG